MESDREARPGQLRPEGLTAFDERRLFHFQNLKESLECKEGQRPDPEKVHQALNSIAMNVQPFPYLGEVGPTDHEAFTENIRNVRDAFLLDAYPFMNESYQARMRMLHGHKTEEITLTPRQKGMLTMITTAAGIPDEPEQLTYQFSSISDSLLPENGQEKTGS